jgi:hypothetical protein
MAASSELSAEPSAELRAAPNAENHDLDVTEAMVDEAIADMARRMNLTPARLDAGLARAGYDPALLRERVRAEMKMRRQSNRLPPQQ